MKNLTILQYLYVVVDKCQLLDEQIGTEKR